MKYNGAFQSKISGGKIVPLLDIRAATTLKEVIKKAKNDILWIWEWNFLTEVGTLGNLKKDMDRVKLDTVGISGLVGYDENDLMS